MSQGAVAERDAVLACLAEVDTVLDKLAALPFDALTPAEVLDVLARREVQARRQPAIDHRLLNLLVAEGAPLQLGATSIPKVLTERLKISSKDANRRLDQAAELGPRTSLTGEKLEPVLPNVAAAQAKGRLGAEHVAKIRLFFHKLPDHVDLETRIHAEAQLAQLASDFDPDYFTKAAHRLFTLLDQDGEYTDRDRRRRRGLTIGKQGTDGMTPISGNLDPEARATLDAVLTKLAAPGMCNPEDSTPCVSGRPTKEQIDADTRTVNQRNHDALIAMGRIALMSKKLGHLNGLPVTVILSTTVDELEKGTGHAVSASGVLVPMSDFIRLGAHAYKCLAVFGKNGEALHLERTRRTASPAQRIMLIARDHGCTAPGCTKPADRTQVHHAAKDWADGGKTNIDDLALACGPDNRKVKPGGWTTRRRNGRTEWLPPPHLDTGQPRINNYHHPENLLLPPEPDDDS